MRSVALPASPDLLILLLIGLFAAAAFQRNVVWQTDVSLWQDVATGNPRSFKAQYGLGDAYYSLGDLSRAAYHYEQAVSLRPGNAGARFNLGITYINLNRGRDAIRELLLVLESNRQDAETHYNLGLAYEKAGLTAPARKEYETALRLKPDFSRALIALIGLNNP